MNEVEKAGRDVHAFKMEQGLDGEKLEEAERSKALFDQFDLTWDELMDEGIAMRLLMSATNGMENGVPVGNLIHGIWVDGLITGLQLAKNRANEKEDK